jgi:hypothetical protein
LHKYPSAHQLSNGVLATFEVQKPTRRMEQLHGALFQPGALGRRGIKVMLGGSAAPRTAGTATEITILALAGETGWYAPNAGTDLQTEVAVRHCG